MNKITLLNDKEGNTMKVILRESGSRAIFINVKGDERMRKVGIVNVKERFFFVLRDRSKHLHTKSNSYGFNYHIIKNAKLFNKVKLADEYGTYLIPNKVILEQGKFLHFKSEGFELQLFLDINKIKTYKLTED